MLNITLELNTEERRVLQNLLERSKRRGNDAVLFAVEYFEQKITQAMDRAAKEIDESISISSVDDGGA